MKDLLDSLKSEVPAAGEFVSTIEEFLTDKGFNSSGFDKILQDKLQSIPNAIKTSLNETNDTQN